MQPLPKTYIVLFTPANVKRPDGVQERPLTQAANYTEKFLVSWMKRWGYPPNRETIFEWTADGEIQVLYVKGTETIKQYRKPSPALAPRCETPPCPSTASNGTGMYGGCGCIWAIHLRSSGSGVAVATQPRAGWDQ